MTTQPHLGFARTLISENRCGGLVHQSTFEPLLCTGCNVEVTGEKFNARVVVTHTFVNSFPCVAPASLGFRIDPAWQVTLLRVDTIDGKFTLSQQQLVGDAQDKNKGGIPVGFSSNEHMAATADTISCDLPWDLLSGQTVTSTLEFLVAMDTSSADASVFGLPSFVSCFDPVRAQEAENSATSWKGRFHLLSSPVAPSSTSVVPKNAVRIRGQLAVPWSAPNNGSAGAAAAKVKVHFNQTSATYKELASYGSIRFEYELQQPKQQQQQQQQGKSEAFSAFLKEGFIATLARPDVVRDATVAVESVTIGFDARAAATERVSVALSLAPNIAHINANRVFPNVEVIFLVDCSDDCVTQWGTKVQDALSIALRGLAADSMFNIVGYGDSVVRAFDRSRYANEQSLDAGENFVNSAASPISRGLGKRKLFDALSTVFTEPCVAGYARTVVVLTNGGCDGNQQQDSTRARVIDLVASNSQIATLLTIGLGNTADIFLLEAMAKNSAAGSLFRSVSQKYSCSFLEIDSELNETAAGFAGIQSSSSYGVNADKINAVAGTLVQSLAAMLRPALASISVRFVSKVDGSVLPEDKIRLASRLPLTIVDGKRVVIFAVASADVPACSILVTGLLGTEQQSFTTDFVGGAEAAKHSANSANAATGKGGDATSSFDLNYVAAVQARLNLVEVFTIRTTLKDDQAAECRRLAGTVRLPSNATSLSTRSEQSAQSWHFGVVHYGWVALARRCNVLPPPKTQTARTFIKTAAAIKSRANSQHAAAADSITKKSSANIVVVLTPLNADADPFAKYSQIATSPAAIRENNGITEHDAFIRDAKVVTVVAAGNVPQGFVRTQRADGLWDSRSEAVWQNVLVRARKINNNNNNDSLTIESLRGQAAATNRRPGSASDLAAARWLAALVIASIENHQNTDVFGAAVGAMAVKKARAALKNDESLISRAIQVLQQK